MIRSTSVRMMEAAADELWAHDTSNASTWRVADIHSGTGDSNPGDDMSRASSVIRSTSMLMMRSSGKELWAHDTSNASTWRVADISSGTGTYSSSNPGQYFGELRR